MSDVPTSELVTLYHGTSVDSALDILNNGLNIDKLTALQSGGAEQLGTGWYAAFDPEVAWFFASLAPGAQQGYTVVEARVPQAELHDMEANGLVVRSRIAGVPFDAEQYRFVPSAFEQLNRIVEFRPYRESSQ